MSDLKQETALESFGREINTVTDFTEAIKASSKHVKDIERAEKEQTRLLRDSDSEATVDKIVDSSFLTEAIKEEMGER